MSDLIITQRGAILELVLNRPEKLNAISDQMLDALRVAIDGYGRNRDLRVLLIRGNGRYFSAGMEIGPTISAEGGQSTLDGRAWYRKKFHTLFDEIEATEKPIVVAHQGPCLGGALELSLSCDFRLAAKSAGYRLPELDIGALPGSGGVSRLTRLVGPHWARWLVMAGEYVDAELALAMGFVHRVIPDEEFEGAVLKFCEKLSAGSYEFQGLAKLSIELVADLDRSQGRNVERICNSILFTGEEHRLLLKALIDRRKAKEAI